VGLSIAGKTFDVVISTLGGSIVQCMRGGEWAEEYVPHCGEYYCLEEGMGMVGLLVSSSL